MKTFLFLVLLLGGIGTIYCNTINQGVNITIVNGTSVTNIGNFNNQAGSIANNGTLEIVDGVFSNTGDPNVGGLVVIRGTDCGLAGTTTFNDVELNTTNPTEVLGGISTFDNNLFVKSGNLLITAGTIDYGTNANLIYNGTTPTLTGAEFPPHFASYNPKTVQVNNPTGVTMQADGQVLYTLILDEGTLTSNGKLYIASTATQTGIVDDFTGVYTGTIAGDMTVERFITNPSGTAFPANFHYVGTPVTGAMASGWGDDFSLATMNGAVNGSPLMPHSDCRTTSLQNGSPYGGLFTYDESLVTFCQYQGWRVRTGAEPANRGKGFAGIIPGNSLLEQTGTYANSDVSFTLSNLGTDPNWKAFHLVSNPFCAPIDWDVNYALTGGGGSDLDGNAYLYNPNTGNYVVFNNINQGFIATSQAFFIRAKDAIRSSPSTTFDATLDRDSRVTTNNNTYYRTGQPYEFALRINVTSPTNTTDNTILAFDPSFSDQYDNGFDAFKLYSDGGVPSIYTKAMNGDKLAIHAIPVNTGLITIPLSLKTEGTGSFTLDFEQVETFPSTMMITLEDLQTGTFRDIRMYPQYVFTGNITDDEGRFLLHFTPQLLLGAADSDCNGQNGYISLEQHGGVIWDYTVFDDQRDAIASSTGFTEFDTIHGVTPGYYTLELHHISGYVTTEEVLVHGAPMVAAFIGTSSTQVRSNDNIDFSASGSATEFTWDMDDGQVLVNPSNPFQYNYNFPGTYTVKLIGSNGVCSDDATVNIIVRAKALQPAPLGQLTSPGSKEEFDPSSVNNPDYDAEISVYHYDGRLFIKQTVLKGNNKSQATIFNGLGQTVQLISDNLPYNQLQVYDLNDLPASRYIVRVQIGDVTETKKFVVTR